MSRVPHEELLAGFIGEVKEYAPIIKEDLRMLLADPDDRSRLRQVYRLFHTIKGAAAQLSLAALSGTSRLAEDMLENLLIDGRSIAEEEVDFYDRTIQRILGYCLEETLTEKTDSTLLEETLGDYHELCGTGASADGVQRDCQVLVSGGSIIERSPVIAVADLLGQAERTVMELSAQLPATPADAATLRERLRHLKRQVLAAETRAEAEGGDIPVAFSQEFISFLHRLEADVLLFDEQAADLLDTYLGFFQLFLLNPGRIESERVDRIVESMVQVRELASLMEGTRREPEGFAGLFDESNLLEHVEEQDELLADLFDEPMFGTESSDLQEYAGADYQERGSDDPVVEDELDLQEIFIAECEGHLQVIGTTLNALEQLVDRPHPVDGPAAAHLAEMRRAVHTLKGAAGMTGHERLARFAHRCEDLLDVLVVPGRVIGPADVRVLSEAVDLIEMMALHPERVDAAAVTSLSGHIGMLLSETDDPDSGTSDEEETDSELAPPLLDSPVAVHPEVSAASAEGDYRHVDQGVLVEPLAAERAHIRVRLENLDELVGLESELIVVRAAMEQRLTDLLHAVAELDLAGTKLKNISQELESGFEVESLYGFGDKSRLVGGSGTHETVMEFSEFDPIELDRYSKLHVIIRSLNELAVDVGSIHHGIAGLANDMRGHVTNQQLLMRVMQDKLMRVRMTPLSSLSRGFFRTVRSAAKDLGKQVRLSIEGEDVYLDRFVWNKVADPIMHILRNAVDHGIERETDRQAAGKPPVGTIRIKAQQRGSQVVMQIEDDGRGIDVAVVRRTLRKRGLLEQVDQLPDAAILDRLFLPGFSTRDEVSRLSGRGVGLDVVRQNLAELRGTVHVRSTLGQGTSFLLRIPISLAINRAAIVLIGNEPFAVPLQDVTEIRKVPAAAISTNSPMTATIGDETLPFHDLAARFRLTDGRSLVGADQAEITVLVVEGEQTRALLAIDSVVAQQEIIVKDLGSHLRHVEGIGGVTIMGDGSLVPILNVSELASPSSMLEKVPEGRPEKTDEGPFTVMIVDDSVSVRQSVSRLMKSKGWTPILATDGVDASEKLDGKRPDAIVLDIEMPRMNGFEFLGMLRSRTSYRDIPVIMLTSRFSEKHRKKAEDLGANHYVIKPYKEDEFVMLLQRFAGKEDR